MLFNLYFGWFLERKLDCEINNCHLSKILMMQLPFILTNISLWSGWIVVMVGNCLFLNIGLFGCFMLIIIGCVWFDFW